MRYTGSAWKGAVMESSFDHSTVCPSLRLVLAGRQPIHPSEQQIAAQAEPSLDTDFLSAFDEGTTPRDSRTSGRGFPWTVSRLEAGCPSAVPAPTPNAE